MRTKTILLSATALCVALVVQAQDKIIKTNGDTILAKVKTVGVKTIDYVRYDNQAGPDYTIAKAQVEKIIYQNGGEDAFYMEGGRMRRPHLPMPMRRAKDDGGMGSKKKLSYAENLLSLAPFQFTENGLGLGLSYEYSLDERGIIAFYLPVILTFDLNNGTYYDPNSGVYKNSPSDMMFYAMPGIKIYPTGSQGFVKYAVGPSLVIADGQKTNTVYDYYTGISSEQKQTHVMLGMIINNSVNFNPSERIYLGLELGLGFTYLNRVGGLNQDTNGLVQGSFKIGYRF
jgi:hypothetical protein